MGEEESKEEVGGASKPAEGKFGSLKTTIVAASFTLLGGIIGVLGKGYYDLRIQDKKGDAELKLEKEKFEESKHLERQKLDSEIIKLVLQSSASDRAETLGFMVDTNLIEDSEIRNGVTAYLAAKKPVPRLETGRGDQISLKVGSPSGRYMAMAHSGGKIDLIETATQKLRFSFETGDSFIEGMSFSPDEHMLVFASDRGVRLSDVITGQLMAFIPSPYPINMVAFSRDGNNVLVGHEGQIEIYDLNGKKVSTK